MAFRDVTKAGDHDRHTKTVRLFEGDVEKIKRESRLNSETPFASHASEVLDRVGERDVREGVRDALEEDAGEA